MLRLVFGLGTLLLVIFAQPASACGTYQTCNFVTIADVAVSPNPADPGQPVTISIDTFQFANWYWTASSMTFTPQVTVTVGGRQLVAELADADLGAVNFYGYPWYGMYWYTQNSSFTHEVVWDGLDAQGQSVREDQAIIVVARAGSAIDGSVHSLTINTTATDKNLGKPCHAIGDPCNPVNGNVYKSRTDYESGDGRLKFERSYNSLWDEDAGLGTGWVSNLHRRIEVGADQLLLRRGDGRGSPVRRVDGAWQVDPDSEFRVAATDGGYLVRRPDGGSETYDAEGKLLREVDASGLPTTFEYGPEGHLTTVTGPYGKQFRFTYGANGHLVSMTDSGGASYQYDYDAEGRLVAVSYPNGRVHRYRYDDPNQPYLSGIEDGTGTSYVSYRYDSEGRVIETRFPTTTNGTPQERFTFEYAGNSVVVTDAAGHRETFIWEENLGRRNVISRMMGDGKGTTYDYDERNNLIAQTDAEAQTREFAYNDANQRTRVTEGVDTPRERTRRIEYLSAQKALPTRIIEPSVLPGAERIRRIEYSDADRPTTIVDSGFRPDATPISRQVDISYDADGRVVAIDGPREDVADIVRYTYYDCETGGACGQPATRTDALGYTTDFEAYDAHGRLLRQRDPNGRQVRYGYDVMGRLVRIEEVTSSGQSRQTEYRYDGAGRLSSASLPGGETLTYTYDAAGDLRRVTDSLGNRVEYRYDVRGNRIEEQLLDPDGTLVRQIRYGHDLRNRIQRINRGGAVTQQVVDAVGRRVSSTDPNGNTTSYAYDSLGNLTEILDPLGGSSRVEFGPGDRETAIEAPNGARTEFVYDDLGNLLAENSPDRGTTRYRYDAAGNPTRYTDARGITVQFTYDAAGRLLNRDYPGSREDVIYQYDGCPNGIGRLCAVENGDQRITYAYDGFGRTRQETRTLLGQDYTLAYTYGAADRPTSLTYPDGREVRYQRDTAGRATEVETDVNGNPLVLVDGVEYRADGQLTTARLGNDHSETRTYNTRGQLIGQRLAGEEREYSYDPAGNLEMRRVQTRTTHYTHDSLDRLIAEQGPQGDLEYTYDANGNRLRLSQQGQATDYAYAPASNRLTAVDGHPVSQDAAGHTTAQGALTFEYNAAGRLSRAERGGQWLADYSYNPLGERSVKRTESGTTVFIYNRDGQLLMEARADGTPLRSYVYLADSPLAQIERRIGQGKGKAKGIAKGKAEPKAAGNAATDVVTWLHTDALKTPRLGTDAAGTIVWRWDSDGFGTSAADTDPDGDGRTTRVRLRFPGQYYDQETGRHYNYFRTYDPSIGRYVTSDPIGLEGGLNTYAYASNAPLNLFDARGLAPGDKFPSSSEAKQDAERYFSERSWWDRLTNTAMTYMLVSLDGGCWTYRTVQPATGFPPVVGRITGFTKHGLMQAISRDGGRGVSAKAMKEAVKNPKKVVAQSGGRTKYVGKDATVVVNKNGKVVTTFGRPRGRVK